jgi:hypothetical protein
MKLKTPLKPDTERCRECGKPTRWLQMKSGALHCEGCSDMFPCLRACHHIDCAVARGHDHVDILGIGTVRMR